MITALFKKIMTESVVYFLAGKRDPTPEELFDEMEKRGIEFCKTNDIDFKDTLTFIQLENARKGKLE
ncbi:MAG: hypothetical protein ACYC9R_12210 [Nitrosotalea sp.]